MPPSPRQAAAASVHRGQIDADRRLDHPDPLRGIVADTRARLLKRDVVEERVVVRPRPDRGDRVRVAQRRHALAGRVQLDRGLRLRILELLQERHRGAIAARQDLAEVEDAAGAEPVALAIADRVAVVGDHCLRLVGHRRLVGGRVAAVSDRRAAVDVARDRRVDRRERRDVHARERAHERRRVGAVAVVDHAHVGEADELRGGERRLDLGCGRAAGDRAASAVGFQATLGTGCKVTRSGVAATFAVEKYTLGCAEAAAGTTSASAASARECLIMSAP